MVIDINKIGGKHKVYHQSFIVTCKGLLLYTSLLAKSINWGEIIFRLILRGFIYINFLFITVALSLNFKELVSKVSLTQYCIVLLTIDLFIKANFYKPDLRIPSFSLLYNGQRAINLLNLVFDIFSFRNTILPLSFYLITAILGFKSDIYLISVFGISILHNTIAKIDLSSIKYTIYILLVLNNIITFSENDNPTNISNTLFLIATFIFVVALRILGNKYYDQTKKPQDHAVFGVDTGFSFTYLNFITFFRSRHYRLIIFKSIVISAVYIYLILFKSSFDGFGILLEFLICFSIFPSILIPYILSSEYNYISLIYTFKSFEIYFKSKLYFLTILNVILAILILAVSLYLKENSIVLDAIIIGTFQVFITTPLMFFGSFYVENQLDIFNRKGRYFLDTPPLYQSLFFIFTLCIIGAILFLSYILLGKFYFLVPLTFSLLGILFRNQYWLFLIKSFSSKKYALYNLLIR